MFLFHHTATLLNSNLLFVCVCVYILRTKDLLDFLNYNNNNNIYPLAFKKANHLEVDKVKNESLFFMYSCLIPLSSNSQS